MLPDVERAKDRRRPWHGCERRGGLNAVNAACLRGLHPDPGRRFATAAAFADGTEQDFAADAPQHPGPPDAAR